MELDPVFIRALRLLHSSSKESGIQLKAMLDESIKMKKNPGLQPSKITASATQQSRDVHVKDSSDSSSIDGSNDATIIDIDIDLEENNCVICTKLSEVKGNKLMKCNECQSSYHQKCHKPAILNQDADTSEWTCFKCCLVNNTDLPTIKLLPKTSKVSALQPPKSSRPASGRTDISSSAVFKRTDTSKSHGTASNSASGGKPAGMAALAATYKGSSGSSASSGLKSSRSGTHGSNFGHSKTSAGSSSGSSSSSTIMSADKRLQLMKKKAAQRKK